MESNYHDLAISELVLRALILSHTLGIPAVGAADWSRKIISVYLDKDSGMIYIDLEKEVK